MFTSDIETIRQALKRLRHLAYQYRYGGLQDDYQLSQQALAALERIEDPQLAMDSGGGDAEAE